MKRKQRQILMSRVAYFAILGIFCESWHQADENEKGSENNGEIWRKCRYDGILKVRPDEPAEQKKTYLDRKAFQKPRLLKDSGGLGKYQFGIGEGTVKYYQR